MFTEIQTITFNKYINNILSDKSNTSFLSVIAILDDKRDVFNPNAKNLFKLVIKHNEDENPKTILKKAIQIEERKDKNFLEFKRTGVAAPIETEHYFYKEVLNFTLKYWKKSGRVTRSKIN